MSVEDKDAKVVESSSSDWSSDSSDSESSDSSSDSSVGQKRKRKHKKHKKKSKHSKSKKKKKDKKKTKKKKKKKDKKTKKHKKQKTESLSLNGQWGAYGIIREGDAYSKQPEFFAWLIEVKNKSREDLSSREEKEMFRMFMEDYNTATFPDTKYYDLAKWEASGGDKRATSGGSNSIYGDLLANNKNLTDEERVRLQRLKDREEAKRAVDNARLLTVKNELKKARDQGSANYEDIRRRHQAKSAPTLESLKKKREQDKQDDASQFKNRFNY